jgi:hypothetical protein
VPTWTPVAVTPASVPLDEDTPPSLELLESLEMPDEEFSSENLNAFSDDLNAFSEDLNALFTITSPKRKRAVSDGGDATEARLNTTATPSAAQPFLHSDHPPQSLAQSAGAAVTGEIENAAPAAVATGMELMNLNDKLECVTGGSDLQAIPFRQISPLEKAWKKGKVPLRFPSSTDAGEIENANTLKKPLTHAAPRPVMFAPAAVAAVAEEDELIFKHVHISEENGPPSRGQIMERKKVGECFEFEGKSYPIKAGLFKTSVGFSLKVFFQPLPLNTNPA